MFVLSWSGVGMFMIPDVLSYNSHYLQKALPQTQSSRRPIIILQLFLFLLNRANSLILRIHNILLFHNHILTPRRLPSPRNRHWCPICTTFLRLLILLLSLNPLARKT